MNPPANPPHGYKIIPPVIPSYVAPGYTPVVQHNQGPKKFSPLAWKAKDYTLVKTSLLDKGIASVLLYIGNPHSSHVFGGKMSGVHFTSVLYHWSLYNAQRKLITDAHSDLNILTAEFPLLVKQDPFYSGAHLWVRDYLAVCTNVEYVSAITVEKCWGLWLWTLKDDVFTKAGDFTLEKKISLIDIATINVVINDVLTEV